MDKNFMLRIIATALVLCSLVLPLSRCEHQPFLLTDGGGTIVEEGKPVTYEYKYAKDWFTLKEWLGWLVLLSFSWPLIILLSRWRSMRIRKSKILPWLEILLCLGSGYVIWTISSFGERLVGAYVAMTGVGLYLLAVANGMFQKITRNAKQT